MQKNPHLLIEGMHHRRGRGRRQPRASSTSAASTCSRPTSSTRPWPRPTSKGYLGEDILGSGHVVSTGRPPRRGRLHLRRGDRPARLARGQARQPAPEAAVPGQPGPLPGADADQQRRDAVERAARDRAAGRSGSSRAAPSSRRARRSCRCPATCSGPGNYEIELGIPAREIIYGLAGGPPPGRVSSAGSRAARRRPCCCQEHLDRPYSFESMAEAGSMLGSGAIIVVDDSVPIVSRGAAAGRVLPARVLRQVRALPRGHQLDREDARADRRRRGHADGPGHHGQGPDQHHRQLPLRAGRLDGDARRLDDQEVPRASSSSTWRWRASARTA